MKEPSVTILVTLKNASSTIKMCIDSLLDLDYKNYEIFVVDAYSTDGSYEILRKYGNKIKLYRLKGWAPVAYNWALKRIHTKYVALIDSDNVVPRDWLKKIMKGSDSPDVLEVVGFCSSPKKVSTLQYLLGKELEDRYKHFKKYLSRAPTMNVVIRTDIAKKLKFDESLRVGYDSDFSLRLSKLGKIKYIPSAKVLHYHRSSWFGFFKQQYITALFTALFSFQKFKSRAKGDEISKFSMILQPFLAHCFVLLLIFSIFEKMLFSLSVIPLIFLMMIWLYDSIRLSEKNIKYMFWYLAIFFVRTFAWSIGFGYGVLRLIFLQIRNYI